MERHFTSLNAFLRQAARRLEGPIALVLVEDDVEIGSTLRHHLEVGFRSVVAFVPRGLPVPPEFAETVWRVDHDTSAEHAMETAVNAMIGAVPGQWIHYCFNAEYLLFPFCETRSVGEMLAFHAEERRAAMLTYVVDLYAEDLGLFPNAVSLEHAQFDRSGYYALARPPRNGALAEPERQLDFYGGLRWRFEEHVPHDRRRIDRIGLFRAKPGLELQWDHTFNDPDYNTHSCQWHHNLTAAICSFRTAKALKSNPGSTDHIATFTWHNSARFEWSSRQLLDLGLIEPGQWF